MSYLQFRNKRESRSKFVHKKDITLFHILEYISRRNLIHIYTVLYLKLLIWDFIVLVFVIKTKNFNMVYFK